MTVKKIKVKQGECMSSYAKKYGFHDPDVIYSHADNSSFKAERKNPHILKKGDAVIIPEKIKKEENCAAGSTHVFKAKGLITQIKLIVEDFEGTPLAGKQYDLEVEDTSLEGTTGSDGLVEKKIDAAAKRGKITVWLDDKKKKSITWPLNIGSLEPSGENSGVQSRLNNLGYSCGKIDGKIGEKTNAAIKAFKIVNGLNKDEVLDAATKDKLKEVFGI